MPRSGARQDLLRRIPKVDQVLAHPSVASLKGSVPATLLKEAVRATVAQVRERVLDGSAGDGEDLSLDRVAASSALRATALDRPRLRRVINATGVVIHTNLGRSILPDAAEGPLAVATGGYCNLEYDIGSGERGSRDALVEDTLRQLTGADAATVVNNCAAAVLLTMAALAEGREVVVSRGELVEIGGSFRIPDVMARSGARLVEVGTTNRTRLSDYARAAGKDTALLMKVHPSNFRIVGFTEETSVPELAGFAKEKGVPLFVDLGSGCLVDLAAKGLAHEPTVPEVLSAGADLVAFSGDKLLGGPQAGIVCGREDLVERVRRHPLKRALRPGKLALAALEATLRVYLEPGAAWERIPALRMMGEPKDSVARRARAVSRRLKGAPVKLSVFDGVSRVGGGALPMHDIPTALLALEADGLPAQALEARLRSGEPPVVGRIVDDRFCLDLRTVLPEEMKALENAIRQSVLKT